MNTLMKTGAGLVATVALSFAGGAALASSLSNDDDTYVYEEVTHDGLEQVEIAAFEFEGSMSSGDATFIYEDPRKGGRSDLDAIDVIGVDVLNGDNR
ncbi:MAG: hypothetical protein U9R74_14085 [Pseudomonadota bacterium]|nr:hypothetical protein [Pseudomonadota bacterium]